MNQYNKRPYAVLALEIIDRAKKEKKLEYITDEWLQVLTACASDIPEEVEEAMIENKGLTYEELLLDHFSRFGLNATRIEFGNAGIETLREFVDRRTLNAKFEYNIECFRKECLSIQTMAKLLKLPEGIIERYMEVRYGTKKVPKSN